MSNEQIEILARHITDNYMKTAITEEQARSFGPQGYAARYMMAYVEIMRETVKYASMPVEENRESLQPLK